MCAAGRKPVSIPKGWAGSLVNMASAMLACCCQRAHMCVAEATEATNYDMGGHVCLDLFRLAMLLLSEHMSVMCQQV